MSQIPAPPEVQAPEPKKSNSVKIVSIIVGGLVVLGLIQALAHDEGVAAAPVASEAVEAPEVPTPEVPSLACLDTDSGARYSTQAVDALRDGLSAAVSHDFVGSGSALHDAADDARLVSGAMEADPSISVPMANAADELDDAGDAAMTGDLLSANRFIKLASSNLQDATTATKLSSVPTC